MATNPLVAQQALAGKSPYDRAHDARHTFLMREFARENGLRESVDFTLDALCRGLRSGGSWGELYRWPGCDHVRFFKRAGRAAAVVTQPYAPSEIDALRTYVAEKGLVMHTPPCPTASFWYPSYAHFAVLTTPSFGQVRWLPCQLKFVRDAP